MSNGDSGLSGIPILGPILGALGNIFGGATQVQDLAHSVSEVEQAAWANTINLASWAFGGLSGVEGALDSLKKAIGKALEKLFEDTIWGWIKKLFEAIKKWITNLRNWIKVHVAALQQIQKNLDRARSQYFRHIIDIVQRIRKILVPFRLLHLGFAKKLDNYLVGLESDIGRKWASLIAHQNAVLGVLNDIIDPRQLMRPGHVLGSLGLMVAAVHGAIGAADVRTLLCLGPDVSGSPLVEPWTPYIAGVSSEVRSHSGEQRDIEAARDRTSQAIAFDLGVSA